MPVSHRRIMNASGTARFRQARRMSPQAGVVVGVLCVAGAVALITGPVTAQDAAPSEADIRSAVERSLPMLELASAGSADQRTCFTCHSQAMPVLAFVEAGRRGILTSRSNRQRQIEHTHQHLQRGLKSYQDGRGQGGGGDTAGYALWTLEDGGWPPDDVTSTVVSWLLQRQDDKGFWKRSSFRPPSEASNFTTTYLALRALGAFGPEDQSEQISDAGIAARKWLDAAKPGDTEDHVFRTLALNLIDPDDEELIEQATGQFKSQQRDDGGWAQLPDLPSDAYATGTVLFALLECGRIAPGDHVWQRAVEFLLKTQRDDGTWRVHSRSKPFQTYYETGFPHRTDQFISTTATAWATIALLHGLPERDTTPVETLAGTEPLDWPEPDLSQRLMQTAHTFVEARIAAANTARKPVRGDASAADERRAELRTLLGIVDERTPSGMEFFGDDRNPPVICETDAYRVLQVRWPVFANFDGEGLLIQPTGTAVGHVILIPDANQTPEDVFGLLSQPGSGRTPASEQRTNPDGDATGEADAAQRRDGTADTGTTSEAESMQNAVPHANRLARHLAENGFQVIIPAVVSRDKLVTDNPRRAKADFTQREWIYRQAFHMGRHVIGYDLQRILAVIDWITANKPGTDAVVGVAGYGEGGLLALHAAAIDPRIDATFVSGYFNNSDAIWNEPIYRNVWSRLKRFGNADVAALIAPRTLIIEHSEFPMITGHKGDLTTPPSTDVRAEMERIPQFDSFCTLLTGLDDAATNRWSDAAVTRFAAALGTQTLEPVAHDPPIDRRQSPTDRAAARQTRMVSQAERHVQSLVERADAVRDNDFLHRAMPESLASGWTTEQSHPHANAERFIEAAQTWRRDFYEQAMGRFDLPLLPPNARTRKVAATEKWTAYDVVLDVHEGLFAWGVLVVPTDLQDGQRRPVVVCQHGRNGVPRDTIDAANPAYNNFAAKLAERGFITFAPHNLYRGEDRYRWFDRKANAIGCTLFSVIIAQHDAVLQWLDSLPFVDGDRIAFYGLSYGGETAVRVPPILEKYCLSICSGDFNQWTRKVASTSEPFSFMNTIEWEMPYWNLGHTFDYAEMSYLMFPRPFMVERGHHDRVGHDQWVAYEFAKVRWLYAQFGKADRVAIEFFQGGHSINGKGTFEFLDRHLRDE